jgi:hypothetical protein
VWLIYSLTTLGILSGSWEVVDLSLVYWSGLLVWLFACHRCEHRLRQWLKHGEGSYNFHSNSGLGFSRVIDLDNSSLEDDAKIPVFLGACDPT